MLLQYAANGIILGATLALGAIGLTLTYNILRFANFAHGEFLTFGAYFALVFITVFAGGAGTLGPLSFGWGLIIAIFIAGGLTAGLALLLDWLLFRMLRKSDIQVTLVISSFGASLLLRNLVIFIWGSQPEYYSRNIAIAIRILPGLRLTADELFVLAITALMMISLHLFLSHTRLGKAMRAVSDNPDLASITGINVQGIIRWTWIVGGSFAAVAGALFGLTVQIAPDMGFNLILPMFAAAILGGIGSIYGAVLGGLIIGLAESMSVPLIGSAYMPAVGFLLMFLILLIYPKGLLGDRS
ncbi:MAG: branched-chain amino acid ABC transporter permease [Castellaniella sp.]|nr:branched-chain amino acid ABC transporter permease [Castellaniella sp.]